jgi:hypothetical protein
MLQVTTPTAGKPQQRSSGGGGQRAQAAGGRVRHAGPSGLGDGPLQRLVQHANAFHLTSDRQAQQIRVRGASAHGVQRCSDSLGLELTCKRVYAIYGASLRRWPAATLAVVRGCRAAVCFSGCCILLCLCDADLMLSDVLARFATAIDTPVTVGEDVGYLEGTLQQTVEGQWCTCFKAPPPPQAI